MYIDSSGRLSRDVSRTYLIKHMTVLVRHLTLHQKISLLGHV